MPRPDHTTPQPTPDRDTYTYPITHLDLIRKGLTSDDTVESLLEPGDGVLRPDFVGGSDTANLGLLSGDTHTWSAHDDEADISAYSRLPR